MSCSRDKTLKFWDRESGYCRRTINVYHEEWVRCCDANSAYFISSGNDKKIFVFSLPDLINFDTHSQVECINAFEVHDNYVESVRIFHDCEL